MFLNLKKVFKTNPVKHLLQGGLLYNDGENLFYIDSNSDIYLFKKTRVQIFRNEIRKVINNDLRVINEDTVLTDLEKKQIALKVKRELESRGAIVEVSPPLSTSFLLENEEYDL